LSRTRRALRRDAPELIALQDDQLGRLPSDGSAPMSSGPVATTIEGHDDPQGDLTRVPPAGDPDGRE
jgi:hypothetical protein